MKRNNWKLMVGAVVLMVSGHAAYGQAPGGPPPDDGQAGQMGRMDHRGGPDRELKMLTKVLSLNADQQKGVKAVLDQQAEQMKALRSGAQSATANGQSAPEEDARQARMAQTKQIHEDTNVKIAALLDDSQKKTYADWEQKRQERMERRGRDEQGGPPPPPDGGGGPPPHM